VNEEASELKAAIIQAQGLAGVAASMDAEVDVVQERLVDLRAATTSATEDQQDLMEEHAVASALQGLHMMPCWNRSPTGSRSAEEEEVGWRAELELTGRIEEMERLKEAAVAEEDNQTASELNAASPSLLNALERAVNEDKKRSSATSGPEESDECVICMFQRKSHLIIPCGHAGWIMDRWRLPNCNLPHSDHDQSGLLQNLLVPLKDGFLQAGSPRLLLRTFP